MKEDIWEKARKVEEEYISRMRKRGERKRAMNERAEKSEEEKKVKENLSNFLGTLTLKTLMKIEDRLSEDEKKSKNYNFIEGEITKDYQDANFEFSQCLVYKLTHPSYLIWPIKYAINKGTFKSFRRKWYLLGHDSNSDARTLKDIKYNANLFWANVTFEFFQKDNGENIYSVCKGIGKNKAREIDEHLGKLKGRQEGPFPIAF